MAEMSDVIVVCNRVFSALPVLTYSIYAAFRFSKNPCFATR